MRPALRVFVLAILIPAAPAQQEPKPPAPVQPPAGAVPDTPPVRVPVSPPPTARQRIHEALGIDFSVTGSKIRRRLIRTDTPYGFAVRSVTAGSPAAQAGIARGTIVLKVDGRPLREVDELTALLQQATPGQKVVLQCSRRKANRSLLDRRPWERFTVELVLPTPPADGKPADGKPADGKR